MLQWLQILKLFAELQIHKLKMSKEGKIRRGKAYHQMRDIDGNYPDDILTNPDKKGDLDAYLDSIKSVEEEVKKGRPKKEA